MFEVALEYKKFKLSNLAVNEHMQGLYALPAGIKDPWQDENVGDDFYYVGFNSQGIHHEVEENARIQLIFSKEPTGYNGKNEDGSFVTPDASSQMEAILNAWDAWGCDDAKTVTGTGTAMALSADCGYAIKVGDCLTVGEESREVTAVTDQQNFTIASAFTSDPSAAACRLESCEVFYNNDIDGNIAAAKADAGGKDWATQALTAEQRKAMMGHGLTFAEKVQLQKDFPA